MRKLPAFFLRPWHGRKFYPCMRARNTIVGIVTLLLITLTSCNKKEAGTADNEQPLFTLQESAKTGISFINQVEYTEEYNTYTYRNFYNGAGVGLADFNRDGLIDIYFCGNIVDNKLYINQGNFQFKDMTESAGVACPGVWSTGVSIADVNGDRWPDIYVCKSGDPDTPHRANELFINNGNLTFTESASEYGIADLGLSTHATFFDYDRDGDLDCYLLNNSFQSVTEFDLRPGEREVRDSLGGNKLYRNEGGHFTDVSEEAGIYGSKIGFGLGVSVADLNRDGWMDLYVSNDFFERDYLYINNGDGTFSEELEEELTEISLGAMGADLADLNNDGYPEIFVTEMTAEGDARLKTKVLFEDWERYRSKVEKGYYHQFARNVLQLNNRNGTFSEIGRMSGVSTTDWSWGALMMDLDNDGYKDIFVANGIFKDLLDRDYLDLYSDPSVMRSMIRSEEQAILRIIDQIPSVRIPNYAFHNNGDMTFTNLAAYWGLDMPSHSNGAAYGDLDNDGDLDLVVNNVNMPSFIYENNSDQLDGHHHLQLQLVGKAENTEAIGSSATLYAEGEIIYQEKVPMRGFKSSMDPRLHFGMGKATHIDSIEVQWPDGSCTRLYDVEVDQLIELVQGVEVVHCPPSITVAAKKIVQEIPGPNGLGYRHIENDFNDFDRNRLLFQMHSNEGPPMAVTDVNGDGLEDLYLGGAKDQPGCLYIQTGNGKFHLSNTGLMELDRGSEDTDAHFFDADMDGDPDLYVTSGSNELPSTSSALLDRLYINNGKGVFSRSDQVLPAGRYESSSCVEAADFDGDGDMDLFVGIRLQPFQYGVPANGYLLENDGFGRFSRVSEEIAPDLIRMGMITDMKWADLEGDGDPDMVVVGDWMPVKVLVNEEGRFSDRSDEYGLSGTEGWWQTIEIADLDGDGDDDFVLGNHGRNSYFRTSPEKPLTMYVNDFDLNGRVEQIICGYSGDTLVPLVLRDDLLRQLPVLASRYQKYADYVGQSIHDMFSTEVLERSVVLPVRVLESCILINDGKGRLALEPLPSEAQYAPVYAILSEDLDGDGRCDLVVGGNQTRAKPQTGIYTASYGLYLKGTGKADFLAVPPLHSGLSILGEIRELKIINVNGSRVLVVVRNNDILRFLKFER
jgi:hypothetical protein